MGMSRGKSPKNVRLSDTMFLTNAAQRIGAKTIPCHVCKKPFAISDPNVGWKGVRVVVEEIRNDWFRGNDTVHFYHPECKP
jgi:hypothetical protein